MLSVDSMISVGSMLSVVGLVGILSAMGKLTAVDTHSMIRIDVAICSEARNWGTGTGNYKLE
jgi:hypothetical protein